MQAALPGLPASAAPSLRASLLCPGSSRAGSAPDLKRDQGSQGVKMKPEPEPETMEPGGRSHQLTEKMTSEDLAAAYGDATRLRAHELTWHLDGVLGNWMHAARQELARPGPLELIHEFPPSSSAPPR